MSPRRRARGGPLDQPGFVREVALDRARVPSFEVYPFAIPCVAKLETLALHPKVTYLIGENGSGKSTLVEAIAIAAGFNAEGGSKGFNFRTTERVASGLHEHLTVTRGARREKDGFFLRAESFFNVATQIDQLGVGQAYGGRSLHDCSHGEAFLALLNHRFGPHGFYILDEPESALSPNRQLSLLALIDHHVRELGSQFLIATHSPIIMAYPDARLLHLSRDGIVETTYEETEHWKTISAFVQSREMFFKHLFDRSEGRADGEGEDGHEGDDDDGGEDGEDPDA